MQQPKAVIRPTSLVEIPLRTQTNYGFSSSMYPLPTGDQQELEKQEMYKNNPLSQSQPVYMSEPTQAPPMSYLNEGFEQHDQQQKQKIQEEHQQKHDIAQTEKTQEKRLLQSQVIIVQSGTQIQTGYPVQNQAVHVSSSPMPNMINTGAQPQVAVSRQQPPMIVRPGGEILNPTLRQVLGHKSSSVKCPQCYHQVMTKVTYVPNGTTHCLAFILFLCLCWCCCCIPYCVNGTRNAQHNCPVCGVFLGLHEVELC